MPQRPPNPTNEEKALEFDGTASDQLDDTYRVRFAVASESENGTVAFDDRGQSHWKWITEISPNTGDVTGTFDQLRALDNPALSLETSAEPEPRRVAKEGYDPYATGVFERPKTRR